MIRTGLGYDLHRLIEGRPLIIGGIEIPFEKGENAHSDGDVLLHALIDALLGAAALGDIGDHFPPSNPQWKDIASSHLLKKTMQLLNAKNWQLVNIDCTLILQAPKLYPFKNAIRQNLAELTHLPSDYVSFKAKTKEKVDAVGAGEAIEAFASVLIEK